MFPTLSPASEIDIREFDRIDISDVKDNTSNTINPITKGMVITPHGIVSYHSFQHQGVSASGYRQCNAKTTLTIYYEGQMISQRFDGFYSASSGKVSYVVCKWLDTLIEQNVIPPLFKE